MAINRFFKPVDYEYTPIPFQELVTLGKYYADERKQAEKDLATNIKTFGKFVSPSAVDMENYNKESIGKLSPFLEQAAANPEVMKDAAWRASMYNQLNNIDYAKLGMLEQSAENLRQGLKVRAQMEAEGLYNKNWDRSDIPNYDTLRNKKVFDDISPVKYLTANELSNAYFDNLKPGDLDPVWKDGIKYRQIGNTFEDLEEIYDHYENDLINTPQGKEYLRQFTIYNNGDVHAAREDFRNMILASQMDRTLRPKLEVDQGWLANEKLRIARAAANTKPDVEPVYPTRQTQIGNDIATRMQDKVGKLDRKVDDSINVLLSAASGYNDEYEKAKANYDETKSDQDFIYMQQMASKRNDALFEAQALPLRTLMRDAFEKTTGFSLDKTPTSNKKYSREAYVKGAKSAVSAISDFVALHPVSDGGDPLLTRAGGTPEEHVLKDGSKTNVYKFENSSGFMLPESIVQLVTDTQPANPVRSMGLSNTGSFPLREMIEKGEVSNVHFIPKSDKNITQIGGKDGESYKVIHGKLRIPADQIRDKLGTGIARRPGVAFVRTSVSTMIKNQFDGDIVKYGNDGEYFEIDGSYVLPADSNDNYWYDIDQLRENSPSHGGVGGSSQAEKQRMSTLYDLME